MNFVTYETAVRLKEAGFPQPEQNAFQVWYVPHYDRNVPFCLPEKYRLQFKSSCVFAPTADDILLNMNDDFLLTTCESVFFVEHRTLPFPACGRHENPAEAAALAWLQYFGK